MGRMRRQDGIERRANKTGALKILVARPRNDMSDDPLSTYRIHESKELNCVFTLWRGFGEGTRFAEQLNEVFQTPIIRQGAAIVQDFRRFQFDPKPGYPFQIADRVTLAEGQPPQNKVAAIVSTDLQYGQVRMYMSRRGSDQDRLVCRSFKEALAFVGAPADVAYPF